MELFYLAITVNFSQAQYTFDEDSGNVKVEVLFSNPSSFDIVVFTITNNITAIGLISSECLVASSESDYLHRVYTLTFPANVTLQAVDIPICDDSVLEENETFSLTIVSNSHPNNVTNGSPDQVNITIIDNDGKWLYSITALH